MPINGNFVLLLTGSSGAGKSTLARLIAKRYRFAVVHGDAVKMELFGDSLIVYKNPRKLAMVHNEMIRRVRTHLRKGHSVVAEYWISSQLINRMRANFGRNLEIRVPFPYREVTLKRNRERMKRGGAFVGEGAIARRYAMLINLRSMIGAQNYLDTSHETPMRTLERHFSWLRKHTFNY